MIEPRHIRKAIVTGATGMIGAGVVRDLLERGIAVTAVIRPGSSKRINLPEHQNLTILEASMRDYETLEPKKTSDYADAFFHLAWMGTYGEARNDCLLQTENIRCTLEAVKMAERFGCYLFIGAGSQAEYQKANMKLAPDSPVLPDTGYGMGKLTAGLMGAKLAKQYGMSFLWTRFFSVYGPGDNSFTMVMSLIQSMLAGKTPDCTAGDQLWDYLYVDDAARAMVLTALYGIEDETYCIGSGSVRPLRDYINDIAAAVGPEAHANLGTRPYFPNQVMHLEADISMLQRDTGFSPSVSFGEGIRRTVEWVKNNP